MNDNRSDQTERVRFPHMSETKRSGRGSKQFHSKLPPFTPLMNELLLDTSISPAAVRVWCFVVYKSWKDNGDAWDEAGLKYADFGAGIGMSENTVRKAVTQLERAGWLSTWNRGQGLAKGYEAHIEPQALTRRNEGGPPADSAAPARASTKRELDTSEDRTIAASPRELVPKLQKIEGRNLAFDALAEATDADPGARGSELAGALNGRGRLIGIRQMFWEDCVDEFGERMLGATPEQFERALANSIHAHALAYHRAMKGAMISPTALRKWWRDAPKLVEKDERSWDDYIKHGPKGAAA